MDDSHTQTTPRLSLRARRPRVPRLLGVLVAVVGLLLAACNGENDLLTPTSGGGTPSPTVSPTATDSTPSATPPPSPEATVEPSERLRGPLLSLISTGTSAQDQAALSQMEVVAIPLEGAAGATGGRDLWAAVTSGPGVWELSTDARHVAAVYERRAADSWVEVAVLPLESEPTIADVEVVVVDAPEGDGLGTWWIGIHGFTGAHSGTFELVRFDGAALSSALWWFSPSPAAASIADLDGDERPEIILDATDPYVYCYACGVRAWGEIIYRWVDGEPVAVNLAPVESTDQRVRDLTEQAIRYVEADLWRRARSTMQLAVEAAPGDAEVWWLRLTVDRIATARIEDVGAPQQPVTTAVLAGEYGAAVDLMRPFQPAAVFDPEGPLLVDTVAEGWHDSMGGYLVEYATRALAVDPQLAPAYAVRAVGRVLVDPDAWAEALLDMDAALALAPQDTFYQDAHRYLLAQNGGASG